VADIVPYHHALGGTPGRRGFVDALQPAAPTVHTLVPTCCARNALTRLLTTRPSTAPNRPSRRVCNRRVNDALRATSLAAGCASPGLGCGSGIAVDGVGRKGGKADRHVVGAVGFGGAVAHPFARTGAHGLPRGYSERSVFVLNEEHAL
jgi:hypothetical protein